MLEDFESSGLGHSERLGLDRQGGSSGLEGGTKREPEIDVRREFIVLEPMNVAIWSPGSN